MQATLLSGNRNEDVIWQRCRCDAACVNTVGRAKGNVARVRVTTYKSRGNHATDPLNYGTLWRELTHHLRCHPCDLRLAQHLLGVKTEIRRVNPHLRKPKNSLFILRSVRCDAVPSGNGYRFSGTYCFLLQGRTHVGASSRPQMLVPINQATRLHIAADRNLHMSTPNLIPMTYFQVCEEQKCQEEVFPLAMNYVDRFLSVCPIRKNQLQLLGTACLLLSSKLRQPHGLATEDLVFYTDNSISIDDLAVSPSGLASCVSSGVEKCLGFMTNTYIYVYHTHTIYIDTQSTLVTTYVYTTPRL
jgi:hypothetical protein